MHAHDFLSIEACLGASWLAVPAVPDRFQPERRHEVLKLCSCHWRVQHGRQFRQCQLQNITHRTTVRQGGQEMSGPEEMWKPGGCPLAERQTCGYTHIHGGRCGASPGQIAAQEKHRARRALRLNRGWRAWIGVGTT